MTKGEFAKIQRILKFVWENPYSDFYRKKYKKAGIHPICDVKKPGDFYKLPFLTKEEIVTFPFLKRLHTTLEEADWVMYSSGTTGLPLLSTRSKSSKAEHELTKAYETFLKDAERLLILRHAKNAVHDFYLYRKRLGKFCVIGDTNNLILSAVIAAECKVDTIIASPSQAITLARYLRKSDLRRIKYLRTVGERVNPLQRLALKRWYPNAREMRIHGNSEIQVVGYQCMKLVKREKPHYHVSPAHFTEICEGELVVTHLEKRGLPLIRYQSGDLASLISDQCSCGRGRVIEISGRKIFRSLHIDKNTELLRTEVEDTLMSHAQYLTGAVSVKAEQQDGKDVFIFDVETEEGVSSSVLTKIKQDLKQLMKRKDPGRSVKLAFELHPPIMRAGKITEFVDYR